MTTIAFDKLIQDAYDYTNDSSNTSVHCGMRVYKSSPEGATLQLSVQAPLQRTESRSLSKAKPRNLKLSVSYLTVEELTEIADAILSVRDQIQASVEGNPVYKPVSLQLAGSDRHGNIHEIVRGADVIGRVHKWHGLFVGDSTATGRISPKDTRREVVDIIVEEYELLEETES